MTMASTRWREPDGSAASKRAFAEGLRERGEAMARIARLSEEARREAFRKRQAELDRVQRRELPPPRPVDDDEEDEPW